MTDAPTDQAPRASGAPTDREDQPGAVATLAQQASTEASHLAHDTGDEVRAVASTAERQASTLAANARDQIGREADDVAARAATTLAATAHDLAAMADGKGSPDAPAATVVREIGDRVERIAEHLQDRGYQGLAGDASRWARNHPAAFLLAAVGTGSAVGRLFRSVDTGAVVDAAKEGAGVGGDGTRELPWPTSAPSSGGAPVSVEAATIDLTEDVGGPPSSGPTSSGPSSSGPSSSGPSSSGPSSGGADLGDRR